MFLIISVLQIIAITLCQSAALNIYKIDVNTRETAHFNSMDAKGFKLTNNSILNIYSYYVNVSRVFCGKNKLLFMSDPSVLPSDVDANVDGKIVLTNQTYFINEVDSTFYIFSTCAWGCDMQFVIYEVLNVWKLSILILAFFIYLKAMELSHNVKFYYASGISLSVLGSFIILIYIIYRLIPMKRSAFLLNIVSSMVFGGFGLMLFFVDSFAAYIKSYALENIEFLVYYTLAVALISFIVMYWFNIPHRLLSNSNMNTGSLVQWILTFVSSCIIIKSINIKMLFGNEKLEIFEGIPIFNHLDASTIMTILGIVLLITMQEGIGFKPPKRKYHKKNHFNKSFHNLSVYSNGDSAMLHTPRNKSFSNRSFQNRSINKSYNGMNTSYNRRSPRQVFDSSGDYDFTDDDE